MIFVIDHDEVMAECVARATGRFEEVRIFNNAIEAMSALSEADELPKMIIMEVMLTGPDGFTFLNELISYPDTANIPVVIVSSVDFTKKDLSVYGVVGALHKETMVPEQIREYVDEYA